MNSSKTTAARRLTGDGRLKMDPACVRGGEEIVYTMLEEPTLLCLMRLPLPGGTPERLHPQAATSEFEPGFSPDGRSYAFVQSRGNLNLKLVIRDTKQNRESVFDPGGGFIGMRRPAISADGRVVFSIPTPTGQELASVNLLGQDRKTLIQGGINNWPAFSPDGRQIAFGSSREGTFQIYVMNADGTGVRRLTSGPGFHARPAWSPDGSRLAFTSNREGSYRVYVLDADGRGLRVVSTDAERADYPAWHPDGRWLVLVCECAGAHDLYLVEAPV